MRQKDYRQAGDLLAQSLALAKEAGDKPGIASALVNLAFLERSRGDHTRAASLDREHLRMQREIGSKAAIAYSLEGLAEVAKSQRNLERATRLFGAARGVRETVGSSLAAADLAAIRGSVASLCTAMGDGMFEKVWAEGRAMTLEQAVEYALAGDTG